MPGKLKGKAYKRKPVLSITAYYKHVGLSQTGIL